MLRPDRIAANAYRTLGLAADASQQAIDAAARKMRILANAQGIPTSPNDLKRLGPVARSSADIEQALAQLNDPVGRVEERFLWLHHPENHDQIADTEELFIAATQSQDPTARHDAVILLLHAAVETDPRLLHPTLWRNASIAAEAFTHCEGYVQAIHAIELAGDFEKRARPQEIEAVGLMLPEVIVAVLLARTRAALDENDFDVCGRAAIALAPVAQTMPRLNALFDDARERLLDKLEDLVDQRCRLTVDEVAARIVCDRKKFARQKKKNHVATRELAAEYNKNIHPALNLVGSLCQQMARTQRIHASAARAMRQLGIAWVWSGQWVAADNTFAAAEILAAGTPFLMSVKEARAENAGRATRTRFGKGKKSGSRGLGWAAFILIGMVIRGLTSYTSNSSSDTAPDTPHYHMPAVGVNRNPPEQHLQGSDHYSDIVKKFQEESNQNGADQTKASYIPPLSLRDLPERPSAPTAPAHSPSGGSPHH